MSELVPDLAERSVLVEESRRLLRAIRLSSVTDHDRAQAAQLIAEASALLEQDAPITPLWHTGLENFEDYDPDVVLDEIFPFSPATGALNPAAPSVKLRVDGSGVIRGEIVFAEVHNGPPFDLTHGGVVAMVYDELLGMAGMLGGGGGFTASLTVDYRRPTPVLVPLELTAWTSAPDGRKLYAHGEMRLDGELLTEARGLFIQPRDLAETVGAPLQD